MGYYVFIMCYVNMYMDIYRYFPCTFVISALILGPALLEPDNLYAHVNVILCSEAEDDNSDKDACLLSSTPWLHLWLEKICRIGHAKQFIHAWCHTVSIDAKARLAPSIWSNSRFSEIWRKRLIRTLLSEIHRCLPQNQPLDRVLAIHWPSIQSFCPALLLGNSFPRPTCRSVIRLMASADEQQFLTFAVDCARLWASQAFVHGVDYGRQRYISTILCFILEQVGYVLLLFFTIYMYICVIFCRLNMYMI